MVREKTSDTGSNGSIIILIVIAIIIIAALAVGISQTSSISTLNQLEFNQANTARNLAYSGIEYAKGMISNYETQGKTIDALVSALNSNSGTINLGTNIGEFTITATKIDSTHVSVSSQGDTPSGAFQAKYASLSENLTFSQSKTTNPNVPTTVTASGIGFSGDFYGNFTVTDSYFFNGGVNIYGSIDYTGTAQNSYGNNCLYIVGTSLGQTVGTGDITSHLCSNTCIVIDGGMIVNANIFSKGDVTITNGTVNGDIYAGGKVTLTWSAHVNGDIYVSGSSTSGSYYTPSDSLMNGTVHYNQQAPSSCTTYQLPEHETVSSSTSIDLKDKGGTTGQLTFVGKPDIDDHSYAYTSIKTGGGTKICFDLSTPNTYINIFDSGNMEINGDIYVRTSTSTNCFDTVNQVTNTEFANYLYASKVYMDILGTVTFNGNSNWFGTIYSKGDITPGGGSKFIGALYCNANINLDSKGRATSGGLKTKFVASDYATKYW